MHAYRVARINQSLRDVLLGCADGVARLAEELPGVLPEYNCTRVPRVPGYHHSGRG
jgi:hypothetical protein